MAGVMGLGSTRAAHGKRAKLTADSVVEAAEAGVAAANDGNCGGALDLLVSAHTAYGRVQAETRGSSLRKRVTKDVKMRQLHAADALIDVRSAFRRHCMAGR